MNYEFEKEKYINKYVMFYPGDTYDKYGYIRDIDSLGYTYEVTHGRGSKGIYFCSHSTKFTFKLLDEKQEMSIKKYYDKK